MATYKVKDDGKAQKGLSAGDEVVTAGGTYKITGVNSDGSYQSQKVSDTTTSNYKGTYANSGGSSNKASSMPSGFSGSATGVGTYTSNQNAIKSQMNSNSQKWWSATAEEQEQLHAANEALSRLLNENGGDVGYDSVSGTWSGSAGYPTEYKDFSYPSAPSYDNRYDEKINELADSILSRDPFSYNYADDPLYQYFASMYQRNGESAMKDTLGEMAARTGGLASSYAGSVAQQSYNNYMQGLNDVIPELYQLAYSMYQDEGDTQRANLEMLQALEQGDYDKYLTLLSQYNTDRNFDYGVLSDQIGLDYQRNRDSISDARYNATASGTTSGTGKQTSEGEDASGDVYSQMYAAGVRTYDDAYAWLRAQGYGTTDANRYANGLVNKIEAGDFDEEDNGYNSAYFNAAINSLSTMLAQGKDENAVSGIESFWDKLSAAQKQQVQELLARYGYSYEEA